LRLTCQRPLLRAAINGTGLLQLLRRPDDDAFHREVRLLPGTPTLERYRSQQLIAFRDFTIDIELEHGAESEGVLVAHGDQGGGYAIYVEQGALHFAYNHYGEMHGLEGGALAAGPRTVSLRAVTGARFTWDFELVVDGTLVASMPGAPMLLGFAPFQGIDVGIDRRSPVAWSVYERHASFPYSGRLVAVTYRPGPAADYDPHHLVDAIRAAGRAAQ
jgi:arylsulfatase